MAGVTLITHPQLKFRPKDEPVCQCNEAEASDERVVAGLVIFLIRFTQTITGQTRHFFRDHIRNFVRGWRHRAKEFFEWWVADFFSERSCCRHKFCIADHGQSRLHQHLEVAVWLGKVSYKLKRKQDRLRPVSMNLGGLGLKWIGWKCKINLLNLLIHLRAKPVD